MVEIKKAKGGKKNRKVGRNKLYILKYRAEHRYEKNKARKMRRHLAKHPNDGCASQCLVRIKRVVPYL